MKSGRKERDLNLDLIRGTAAFLVLSVHFFMYIGYYDATLEGERLFAYTIVRDAFMVCVPLFLLLSGCLQRKKRLCAGFYRGIVHTLLTYLLAGIVCRCVHYAYTGLPFDALDLLTHLLDYSAAPYAWYIEMYVGLFLMMPFLNAAYGAMEGRRQKLALVLTCVALTALPTVANLGFKLIPEWWSVAIYPVAYYMIGAYLGEFQPKPSWRVALPLLALIVLVNGSVDFLLHRGQTLTTTAFNNWSGAGIMASTVLLFILMRQIPLQRLPAWTKRLIYKSSELSLGIYLISWCFDDKFYFQLNTRIVVLTDKWLYYFAVVPAVYLCSALTAQGIEMLRKGITAGLNRLFPRLRLP